jgi:hypothetical protein
MGDLLSGHDHMDVLANDVYGNEGHTANRGEDRARTETD